LSRFAPPVFAAIAAIAAAVLTGCGPTERGTVYSDAGEDEAEAGSELVAVLAPRGDEPVDATAEPPEDAPPAGDGEAEPPETGNDRAATGSEIELTAAETTEDEEDDGFSGGFSGGFASPGPTTDVPAEPQVENAANDGPRDLKLLVPINSFGPAGNGTKRVSFDDLDLLKVLNAEPVPADVVDEFPQWLSDLDGEKITLRGFMYPTYADPVKAFVLARDNQICCFGRNPKPYDLVKVILAEGEESRYIQNRPFDVVGTFHVDPQRDGDEWLRLYRIDGARVVE